VPELPEVETTRRALEERLLGRRIRAVRVHRGDLRRPVPPQLPARLAGRRLSGFGRRGKYLLFHLDDGAVLLLHLGMSGRLLLDGSGAKPHEHLEWLFTDGSRLSFVDPRRFGLVDLIDCGALERDPRLSRLGPEPLAPDFDGRALRQRLLGRRSSIYAALLDQHTVAGLGNIYVCEALFRAGIRPHRPAGELGPRRCGRLAAEIREVLREALGEGGSSLRDYVSADGMLGRFQNRFSVYGREGEPCVRCRGRVRRSVRGGRSIFFCPRCQR